MEHETFGQWLKRRRRALDLTQPALAEQVGCAVETVRKIEAGTRRPSRVVAERLANALAVAPEERTAFVGWARGLPRDVSADAVPPTRSSPPPRVSLPTPPTALVGRASEIATVQHLFEQARTRMVTLTGPGGSGKTRLALQVATELAASYNDGVWFVDLARINDPGLVLSTIAESLGVVEASGAPSIESLAAFLQQRQLLLVLDNFEHVQAAAPLLTHLLSAAPHLHMLVTSRASLRISGEHEYPVPPLALPEAYHFANLDALRQVEAVDLFVRRAQAVAPAFVLTEANAAAIATICSRLDGLPLALELAAARCRVLAPEDLLARLDDRLQLLTGGTRDMPDRQRTLRATIDWSYSLLSPHEQQLFTRLAVFIGGWSLAAAEAICQPDAGDSWRAIDGLQALAEQSLVYSTVDPTGHTRMHMLETIRAYAHDLLAPAELECLRGRHAAYYLEVALEAERCWDAPGEAEQLARLVTERANLRAALQWALDRQATSFVYQLNAALFSFWSYCSDVDEARRWLEATLALPDASRVAPALRAKVWNVAGYANLASGQLARARACFEQGLKMYRELRDRRGEAWSLRGCGFVALLAGDTPAAEGCVEASLAICRATGDHWGLAWSLYDLGYLAVVRQHWQQASTLLEEGLHELRSQGILFGTYRALLVLGSVRLQQQRNTEAIALFREGLTLSRQPRFLHLVADGIEGVAAIAADHDQSAQAARLLGAADMLRGVTGMQRWLFDETTQQRVAAQVRLRLGARPWEAAYAEGRALSLEAAIDHAIDVASALLEGS